MVNKIKSEELIQALIKIGLGNSSNINFNRNVK